jgi:biopolymer transport protein ExbD
MRTYRKQATNAWVQMIVNVLADGKLSPEALQKIMHKVNEFGGTAVALGTTAISIYTGLKGVLGE